MTRKDNAEASVEIPFTLNSLGLAIFHLRNHNHQNAREDVDLAKHLVTLDNAVHFLSYREDADSDTQRHIAQTLADSINKAREHLLNLRIQ